MSIIRAGSPRGRIEYLLRQAAEDWIDLNFDGPGLLSHATTDNEFLKIAEKMWYEVLIESEWVPDPPLRSRQPRPYKKPIIKDDLPEDGLYILYYHLKDLPDEGRECLYIGKSIRVRKRQQEHQSSSPWWNEIDCMRFDILPDQRSLDEAEVQAIKTLHPKYNKVHNNG